RRGYFPNFIGRASKKRRITGDLAVTVAAAETRVDVGVTDGARDNHIADIDAAHEAAAGADVNRQFQIRIIRKHRRVNDAGGDFPDAAADNDDVVSGV